MPPLRGRMAPTAVCSCVFVMQMAVMCHGADAKDEERGTTTCRDYRRSDVQAGDSPILSGILMRSLDARQCISNYDIFSTHT